MNWNTVDSADPPLAVHCLYGDRHRQLRRLGAGDEPPPLGDLLAAAPARLAPVHRSVLVRAAVCHQVAQRATHASRQQSWSEHDGRQDVRESRRRSQRRPPPGGSLRRRPHRADGTEVAARKAAKPALLAGGNPQIAKGDGDAPVQAYIAAMPGWKRDVGRRLDALIVRTVPDVRKAVKWNSPFYGVEGQGWFLNFHCFTNYVKVAFFRGTSLRPVPPGESKHKDVRYLDIHEDDSARRGADGDVDPAGGRAARLGPVAPARTSAYLSRRSTRRARRAAPDCR